MATTTPATTHRSKDSQAQASEGFAVTIACSEDEDTTADCAMDVYLKGGGACRNRGRSEPKRRDDCLLSVTGWWLSL